MKQARKIRWIALLAMVGLVGNLGCIHNHYYGYPAATVGAPAVSVCDTPIGTITASNPTTNPRVNVGDVCEVAPNGTVVSQNGSRASGGQARTIVSQPIGSGRLAWRSRSPESLATTKVEGAYDGDTTVK